MDIIQFICYYAFNMSNKNKHIPLETPDYGFDQGLHITARNVRSGEEETHLFSQEELRLLPSHGQSPENDARIAEQLERNRTIAMGLGGRAVELSHAGSDDAQNVMVTLYGWGGDMSHPVAIGEAQALAAANPDTRHVFINTAGVGGTDSFPRSIEKEITQHGHYGALGEHYVEAVRNAGILDDSLPVDLRGHSLGGRTAIGMAAHLDDARSLVVNDPTGSEKLNLSQLGKRFIFEEGRHLGAYQKTAFDPASVALQKEGLKLSIGDLLRRSRQQFLIDPRGLGHESLAHDLTDALPNISEEIRIISPELSALNNWENVAKILSNIVDTAQSTALLEQWVVHGHSHSLLGGSNSGIVAELYRRRSP